LYLVISLLIDKFMKYFVVILSVSLIVNCSWISMLY
jgi:hypothetical protein